MAFFQFVVLPFLIACVASGLAVIGPVYPQRVFHRSVSRLSVYSSSFCLEDGSETFSQGSQGAQYVAIAGCKYGQIRIGPSGESLQFGQTGSSAVSWVDLGPFTELREKLAIPIPVSLQTAYVSLSVCKDTICAASNISSKGDIICSPVRPELVSGLLETASAGVLTPAIGNAYILRVTTGEVVTKTVVVDTTLIVKLVVGAHPSSGVFNVEWSVFWGEQPPNPPAHSSEVRSEQSSDGHPHSLEGIKFSAIAGVTLGVISFIAVTALSIVMYVHMKRGATPSEYTAVK